MLECEENTPTFDVEPKKATFSFAFPEGESQTNVILSASEISHRTIALLIIPSL